VNKIRLPLAWSISTSRSRPSLSRTYASRRSRLGSSSTRSSPARSTTRNRSASSGQPMSSTPSATRSATKCCPSIRGVDHHLFPRGPSLPRVAAMIRVLIDRPSFAWQRDSSTAHVVAVRSPSVPPTDSVPAHVTSSVSRLSSGTAKGTSGCARRHGGLLLSWTPPPKQVWVLFTNILGLTIWVERKLWLRDTGRKLKHLDQEIHSGQNELSAEILARFGEE
jgi:hypothetical protein